MKKQDTITLLFTFVTGFFLGMYLYTSDFAYIFGGDSNVPAASASELIIVGEAYGGCRAACPSFQVLGDGTYRYLYTPGAGAEQVIRDGSLPLGLQIELKKTLTRAALLPQAEVIEPAFCNSYTDGIDTVYTVTLDNIAYTLDTCGSDVRVESDAWQALVKIWNYFETGEY